MRIFFDRLRTSKQLNLQDSVTGYPAVERQLATDFHSLPDNKKRDLLKDLAFTIEPDSWKKIEELLGDDISLETDSFIGNCEDYVHSVYPKIPRRVLADKSFLESSFIPKDQVKANERYLIIYWGDEEANALDAQRAGYIKMDAQIPKGRIMPVHVGIIQGDTVVSKFSLSGGLVKYAVTSVPSNFGEKYSYHKLS